MLTCSFEIARHASKHNEFTIPCWLQVVVSSDLEGILGKRPYNAAELRNIDKFRDGFGGKIADDQPAPEEDESNANDSGDDEGPPPNSGSGTTEPVFKRPIFGGGVVAT